MLKSLSSVTYESAVEYGQSVLSLLREREEYAEIESRAASLGVTLTVSFRHTYANDFRLSYTTPESYTGRVGPGYSMELWFDFVRGGSVLRSAGEEAPTQFSYAVVLIEQVSYFLFSRIAFYDLDAVLDDAPVFAVLEEYLDRIEEEGAVPSLFVNDSLCPTTPRGTPDLIVGIDGVGDGAYTELTAHPYTGAVGAPDSLYFTSDAFFPYRLILAGIIGEELEFPGTALTLTDEGTDDFASVLEEMPALLRRERTFADVLSSDCSLTAFAPPPRAEQLLNNLTYHRKSAFLSDCAALAEYLREMADAGNALTVIL